METNQFEFNNGKVKFSRRWIMSTLKYFSNKSNKSKTLIEISKILKEIEVFEEKLSNRFNDCIQYDPDIDKDYVDEILYNMQQQVNFFILACIENTQREFNPSIA